MNKNNISKILVGFATGEDTNIELPVSGAFKKFTGVAPFHVVAINPNLDEIKKFLPNYQGKDPVYLSKKEDKSESIRLTLWLKLDTTNDIVKESIEEGKDYYFQVSLFLEGAYRFNNDRTKVFVINQYGDTTWVPVEMVKTQGLPDYAEANEFQLPYRPCFIGEDLLVKTVKAIRGIPMTKEFDKVTKSYFLKSAEELVKCKAEFSEQNIKEIVTGNLTSVKSAFNVTNKIKYPLAIRKSDDNREYQEIVSRYPMSNRTNSYNSIIKDITKEKEQGRFSNIEFGNMDLVFREYKDTPTTFGDIINTPKNDSDSIATGLPWD